MVKPVPGGKWQYNHRQEAEVNNIIVLWTVVLRVNLRLNNDPVQESAVLLYYVLFMSEAKY